LRTIRPALGPFGLFPLDPRGHRRETPPEMPLHFYAPAQLPCKLCGVGFEHHARASDPPLAACPTCGQSVRRQITQSISSPKLSGGISVSNAKQAGFAVLKRTSDGHFEKQ